MENPFEGVGKSEALKHELSGLWSREINKKDRLLYRVKEELVTVVVISAMGHYSDK
ncbi:Txe/YoeB family addiction module toxin [Flavobacterium sp. NPDC079362]|uniref:Txe/YoeB family addiction module toxin n=1 Tax=Flavobacterium sp. NPDC079362 TaxID=3390566 RepID=UPI003D06B4F9